MRQQTYESAPGHIPVFQAVDHTWQGGFTLDDTAITAGTILPQGTPIGFNEETRLARVAKAAQIQADAANNATAIRVTKGSPFKVGQTITSTKAGATPRAISSIVTTDPNFDELTLAATLGVALTAGDAVFINDYGYGAEGSVGLLFLPVEAGKDQEVSVVLEGIVYAKRIPPIPLELRNRMPKITFSESF